MANKIKVADKFDGVIALLNGEPTEFTVEQAVEFLLDRKAKHTAKANGERKPTKTQLENEGIKEQILGVLTTEPKSVGDICTEVGISNQKATALLTQLLTANAVVRTEVKGKAHYALPAEVE
jgi:hypothetical protein